MKTSNKILAGTFGLVGLILFLFLIFVRFNIGPSGMGNGDKLIEGNGTLTTTQHSISNYNEIYLDEDFTVEIKVGSEFLSLTAEDNLIQYIKPEVKNGQLQINIDESVSLQPSTPIQMTIGVQSLSKLACAGNSHIASSDTLKSEELNLQVSGSGSIDLTLQSKGIYSSVSGSGYIKLNGNSESLTTVISGSGRVTAKNLVTQNVKASVAGSGYTTVHATKNLDVSITGSGGVSYKGQPQIEKQIAGSGRLQEID